MIQVLEPPPAAQTRGDEDRPSALRQPAAPPLSEASIRDLVKMFKLLADETRLRILFYLTQRTEFHVRALCDLLAQSQPAVSHHLALLRVAGLIERRREGKHNYYHVIPDRLHQLFDLLFADTPIEKRRIRFENYVLTYEPPRA